MFADDDNYDEDESSEAPEVYGEVVDAVVAVLELLATRADEGRLKRRIVELSNTFAPQEVSQIYRMLAENIDPDGLALMARLAPQWRYFTSRTGAAFHRDILAAGAVLYRSAVKGAVRGGLVAFGAGTTHNLFMANVRFLDMLGHLPIDVLILSNHRGAHGRWNMGGGSRFVALRRLKALMAAKDVTPRCYVGASAGGESALVAASLDHGARGIALSGRLFVPGRSIPLSHAVQAHLPMCACWPNPASLHALYNANEPVDADNHRILGSLAPHARIYRIPDDARHNPMATLAARGKLRPVMAQIAEAAFGREPDFDLVCAS